MFKYYFEQIQNVAIWPIISLTIFFAFFIALIWWVIKVDRGYIKKMKQMPLDKDGEQKSSGLVQKGLMVLALLTVPQWGFFSDGKQCARSGNCDSMDTDFGDRDSHLGTNGCYIHTQCVAIGS